MSNAKRSIVMLLVLVCGVVLTGCGMQATPELITSVKNQTPPELIISVSNGDIDTVKSMLEEKPELVNTTFAFDHTPLHYAARHGPKEIVKLFIDKGAEINSKDSEGYTPLHVATLELNKDIAGLLIANGADVNARAENGSTPLLLLTLTLLGINRDNPKAIEVAKLLIVNGADVNVEGPYGMTPLHNVASHGSKDIAELLIEKGANMNVKDEFEQTPLDVAIIYGYNQTALLLHKHGAVSGSQEFAFAKAFPTYLINAIHTIAVAPNGGVLADAIGVELVNRGYNIIDTNVVADVMTRHNLNETQIEEPRNLLLLKKEGIDALVSVKSVTEHDGLLQKANVQVKITHIKGYISSPSLGWGDRGTSPAEAAKAVVNMLAEHILIEPPTQPTVEPKEKPK